MEKIEIDEQKERKRTGVATTATAKQEARAGESTPSLNNNSKDILLLPLILPLPRSCAPLSYPDPLNLLFSSFVRVLSLVPSCALPTIHSVRPPFSTETASRRLSRGEVRMQMQLHRVRTRARERARLDNGARYFRAVAPARFFHLHARPRHSANIIVPNLRKTRTGSGDSACETFTSVANRPEVVDGEEAERGWVRVVTSRST